MLSNLISKVISPTLTLSYLVTRFSYVGSYICGQSVGVIEYGATLFHRPTGLKYRVTKGFLKSDRPKKGVREAQDDSNEGKRIEKKRW